MHTAATMPFYNPTIKDIGFVGEGTLFLSYVTRTA